MTKNMLHSRIKDSTGDFTISSNGDRLARYAVLALDQKRDAYILASTFQIEEEQKSVFGENLTKLVNITWPGSCEDRIYREMAIRRSGNMS